MSRIQIASLAMTPKGDARVPLGWVCASCGRYDLGFGGEGQWTQDLAVEVIRDCPVRSADENADALDYAPDLFEEVKRSMD